MKRNRKQVDIEGSLRSASHRLLWNQRALRTIIKNSFLRSHEKHSRKQQ